MAWTRIQLDIDKPRQGETLPPPEIELKRPESWYIWRLLQVTDWKHLPYPGSLLEQPDWWLADMLTLNSRNAQMKDMLKPENK